jgi:diacylglycerol diphosphate phosphatase/phosphatidate phosphatase
MGLFNRKTAPVAADTTTTTGAHHREKSGGHGTASHNSRPTFGQWIKATALDIITMAIMGAIGLGVYMADPAPSRSFPVTFQDGEVVYPEFAYPLRNEIIPVGHRYAPRRVVKANIRRSGPQLSWPSSSHSSSS